MINDGIIAFHDSLEPLLVDIDSIHQHPRNYNNGDVEEIATSIEINGMYRPVYVRIETNDILAGNSTWEACKALGATRIPAVFLDVDDDTALRILLADNQLAALARPDNAALLELLEDLAARDSLMGSGFVDRDIATLRALANVPVSYPPVASWPTIHVQVPPEVRAAYYAMTASAGGERERFELLMRLAGWDGKAPQMSDEQARR